MKHVSMLILPDWVLPSKSKNGTTIANTLIRFSPSSSMSCRGRVANLDGAGS